MEKKAVELISPPIEYEKLGQVEQIKQQIVNSFLERTKNTINEKRGYCLNNGLSLDQANYIIKTAIQALASLVPLKNEGKDLCELELLPCLGLATKISVTKLPTWPPKDEEIPENAYSL